MRILGLIFMMSVPYLLYSQTLTRDAYWNSLELDRISYRDSTLPANAWTAGSALRWDFSGVSGIADTLRAEHSISPPFPYADSFPTANTCTRNDAEARDYSYYRIDGNDIWVQGMYHTSDGTYENVGHPGVLLRFPMGVGSNWEFVDTIRVQGAPGIAFTIPMTVSARVNASGTIITPLQEFPVILLRLQLDGSFIYMGITIPVHRTQVLAFSEVYGEVGGWDSLFVDAPYRPIVSKSRYWIDKMTNGIETPLQSEPQRFQVYPCPAQRWVQTISVTSPGIMEIYSLEGEILYRFDLCPTIQKAEFDLPLGFYSVRFSAGDIEQWGRIIIGPKVSRNH
jgi:hypothetical protein